VAGVAGGWGIRRSTHYEGVLVRCSRVQSPPKLHVRRLLLVAIVGY
jgi:hypothetical protein